MNDSAATLARRVAAYAAAAGATLALAPQGQTQVVYTDIDPDEVIGFDEQRGFDVDGDGVNDFIIHNYRNNPPWYEYLRVFSHRPDDNQFLGTYFYYDNLGCAVRFSLGNIVGEEDPDATFFPFNNFAWYTWNYCNFFNQEGYAGFKFIAADGEQHLGWLRLSHTSNPWQGTFYEFAYEQTPSKPILAGARTSVELGGAIDQTDFPASGGTLRYAFEATNPTEAPLDLWAVATRDGVPLTAGPLAAVTLAEGAHTDTLAVEIPAHLPSGPFTVTFHLGDLGRAYPALSESFEVTKATGTSVEPDRPEGAWTHLLSAAMPNPSTGRSRLTLAVTRTQAVRLTVHDALGREVAQLHDGVLAAGSPHPFTFDGTSLPAGAYAVRAVGEAFSDVRVLTLSR